MFDIIFISYQESNAEEHWEKLNKRFPFNTIRVKDVQGIPQAHYEAAKRSRTKWFYVVDGDTVVNDDFMFDIDPNIESDYSLNADEWVFVMRAYNPVTELTYGYSGIKLFNKKHVLTFDPDVIVDFTTTVAGIFKAMPIIASTTVYDTSPFETWKSAFRECTKLSANVIKGNKPDETRERLKQWMNTGNGEYGLFSKQGAVYGHQYGSANANNPEELARINNFEWLKEQFNGNT